MSLCLICIAIKILNLKWIWARCNIEKVVQMRCVLSYFSVVRRRVNIRFWIATWNQQIAFSWIWSISRCRGSRCQWYKPFPSINFSENHNIRIPNVTRISRYQFKRNWSAEKSIKVSRWWHTNLLSGCKYWMMVDYPINWTDRPFILSLSVSVGGICIMY